MKSQQFLLNPGAGRSTMYESLYSLVIFLLIWTIGDAIYLLIYKAALESVRKHLSKEMIGLFQVGLVLIGSADLLGVSAIGLGFVLCLLAALLDLLGTFSEE